MLILAYQKQTLFECETSACGGFDFRYGTAIFGLERSGDEITAVLTNRGRETGARTGRTDLLDERTRCTGHPRLAPS